GIPPGSDLDWSLAEEVAREAVSSGRNETEGVRTTLPLRVGGRTTWLAVLHESETPLKFDTLWGIDIEHQDGRKTSVIGGYYTSGAAIASNYVMCSGIHYAEFHLTECSCIGVVRPLNLSPDRFANGAFHFHVRNFFGDFLAARTDTWGRGNVHSCDYNLKDGLMSWTNWDDLAETFLEWEGVEGCLSGDTLGMVLNLDEGTLSVYKNNRRLGVMKDGLCGSYCWCVSVWEAVQLRSK
ncbi:hypothetical protein THAOC_27129, partial [Thalassiosira oceanica]